MKSSLKRSDDHAYLDALLRFQNFCDGNGTSFSAEMVQLINQRIGYAPPPRPEFEEAVKPNNVLIAQRARRERERRVGYTACKVIGEKIREVRRAKGITQTTFAARVGVGSAHICRIEKGTRPIGIELVQRIALALDLPISELSLDP